MKKEFTLRLDDAACAELENLKKLSVDDYLSSFEALKKTTD